MSKINEDDNKHKKILSQYTAFISGGLSPTDKDPGCAYVSQPRGTKTIELDEPHVDSALRLLADSQDAPKYEICVESRDDAQQLAAELIEQTTVFLETVVAIYYPQDGTIQRLRVGARTQRPTQYETAFERFVATYTTADDAESIEMSVFIDRFANWYRNLTGDDSPTQPQVAKMLSAQSEIETTGSSINRRRWILGGKSN